MVSEPSGKQWDIMASLHPWHLGPSWLAMGVGLLSVPCVAVARTLFQATGRRTLHHTLECFVLRQERSFFPLRTPIPKGEGDGGISNALKSVRTGTP